MFSGPLAEPFFWFEFGAALVMFGSPMVAIGSGILAVTCIRREVHPSVAKAGLVADGIVLLSVVLVLAGAPIAERLGLNAGIIAIISLAVLTLSIAAMVILSTVLGVALGTRRHFAEED